MNDPFQSDALFELAQREAERLRRATEEARQSAAVLDALAQLADSMGAAEVAASVRALARLETVLVPRAEVGLPCDEAASPVDGGAETHADETEAIPGDAPPEEPAEVLASGVRRLGSRPDLLEEYMRGGGTGDLLPHAQVEARLRALESDVEALGSAKRTRSNRCRLKSLVANAKALRLRTDDEDLIARADIARERLRALHETVFARDGYVFGMSMHHRLTPLEWENLAAAYLALASASDALTWVHSAGTRAPERDRILSACWAAQAAVWRAMEPCGSALSHDEDQRSVRDDVLELVEEHGASASVTTDLSRVALARLIAQASGLRELLREARARVELERRAETALQAVLAAAKDEAPGASGHDDASEAEMAHLVNVVQDALAAGVRPADVRLREALLPWTDALAEMGDEGLEPVLRELRAEAIRRAAGDLPASEETVEDPESEAAYLAHRAAVRDLVGGKRLLLVGGVARPETSAAIRDELGLAHVEWPSTSPATPPSFFDRYVREADVVARLVAFGRKGYRALLEDARDQGKLAVNVRKGYNPRRMVEEIYRQHVHRPHHDREG